MYWVLFSLSLNFLKKILKSQPAETLSVVWMNESVFSDGRFPFALYFVTLLPPLCCDLVRFPASVEVFIWYAGGSFSVSMDPRVRFGTSLSISRFLGGFAAVSVYLCIKGRWSCLHRQMIIFHVYPDLINFSALYYFDHKWKSELISNEGCVVSDFDALLAGEVGGVEFGKLPFGACEDPIRCVSAEGHAAN